MEDRRRRRRMSGGSDSGDERSADRSADTSGAPDEDGSDHEYESAADESLLESSDQENDEGGRESPYPKGSGSSLDESNVRGAGDGQEEAKVDDDEDRRNPQYIPKRGNFYEHDDREDEETVKDGDGDDKEPAAEEAKKKSKVWRSEQTERWGHDKFMEMEQAPKTKEELVNAYGYDIRNEDNAPRARRRRRYGRGPNKYTRKWEDEEAYGPGERQSGAVGPAGRGGRGGGRGGAGGRRRASPPPPKEEEPLRAEPRNPRRGNPPSTRRVDAKTNRDNGDVRSRVGRGGRGGRFDGVGMREAKPGSGPRSRPPAPFPSKKVDQAVEAKLDAVEREVANVRLDHQETKPKRYSTQRHHHQQQQPPPPSQPSPTHLASRNGYEDPQQQQQMPKRQPPAPLQQRAPGRNQGYSSPNSYVFPTTASGPPPSAPFLSAVTTNSSVPNPAAAAAAAQLAAAVAAAGNPPSYIPPGGVYAPSGPGQNMNQFGGAVPVTVAPLMVGGPPGTTAADLAVLAQQHHHLSAVSSPEQVLLAAAVAAGAQGAAAGHGQGYAEVRGGVTYFNQPAVVPSRQPISKRPKAAIPIVDPSQIVTAQSSVDESEGLDAAGGKNNLERVNNSIVSEAAVM